MCSDAEDKSTFEDFLVLQMLNLIRKEKVILKGSGETEGGGRGQLLRERAQTATEHYCVMPKGETEHTNISQQRQHWAKCVLCLSDVVVFDGFLT